MAHIKIRRGLDIPLKGSASGSIRSEIETNEVALDFSPFAPYIHPQLLIDVGDLVLTGQPLIKEKGPIGRLWTSPATGVIKEIRRGQKRSLESIVITKSPINKDAILPELNTKEPIQFLVETGLLSYFTMRPFCLPAHPNLKPRSIFIRAIESAPFRPAPEKQLEGNEHFFQTGLDFISSITPETTNLISATNSPFSQFQRVRLHTAEGPHPVANASLHIQLIDPILKLHDVVWTIDPHGVIAIGRAIETGKLHPSCIISIAGLGIAEEHRGYYKVPDGASVQSILEGKLSLTPSRLISGDPLTGLETSLNGHLAFGHTVVCAIPDDSERQPLHFFRFKSPFFTATRAYKESSPISTRLHGEERAFIDPNIYDRVMPLQIPTVPLIKSILADDFETAELLGVLEVAPEDFALPTFICPSKIEMTEIVRRGQQKMAAENLSV
jgi:Na+-transporting NADH:ubiquinone oxidoreductase subunit A